MSRKQTKEEKRARWVSMRPKSMTNAESNGNTKGNFPRKKMNLFSLAAIMGLGLQFRLKREENSLRSQEKALSREAPKL